MLRKYTVSDSGCVKVAVLISNGKDGCGWSTWNRDKIASEQMLFDVDIVKAVLDCDIDLAMRLAKDRYGENFIDAAATLVVEWIPKGAMFSIGEHAGKEWIIYGDYTA